MINKIKKMGVFSSTPKKTKPSKPRKVKANRSKHLSSNTVTMDVESVALDESARCLAFTNSPSLAGVTIPNAIDMNVK